MLPPDDKAEQQPLADRSKRERVHTEQSSQERPIDNIGEPSVERPARPEDPIIIGVTGGTQEEDFEHSYYGIPAPFAAGLCGS